ncbi:hypothetical protein CV730_04250 [Helicobacter pylori]|nr:hypothetical protein CV730_04250 [Helicobacter pylori]
MLFSFSSIIKKIIDIIIDKDNPKSYCYNYSLKSILVMKTALFKLLNQTIIPRYATNHNIKFQTRLSPPFFKYQFFIPLI